MEVRKQGAAAGAGVPDAAQLEKINAIARGTLAAEEVYVFSVRLCDDRVDRDGERFTPEALRALAPMFVGKTGIVDHNWSADRQVARVFDCACECADGETYLLAWAYMLRSEKNAELIREIEGGIRREVSVGCAMGAARCSICGEEYGACSHRKGETYGGRVCCVELGEPIDAYEFSFVAVPAQPRAGVVKAWRGGAGGGVEARKALEADAALGREYLGVLRRDFTKNALLLDLGLDEAALAAIAGHMSADELKRAGAQLQRRAGTLYPLHTQLPGAETGAEAALGSEFLI